MRQSGAVVRVDKGHIAQNYDGRWRLCLRQAGAKGKKQ